MTAQIIIPQSSFKSDTFGAKMNALRSSGATMVTFANQRLEKLTASGFADEAKDILVRNLSAPLKGLRDAARDRLTDLERSDRDRKTPKFATGGDAAAIAAAFKRENIRQRVAAMKVTDAFGLAVTNNDVAEALLEAGQAASNLTPDLWERLEYSYAERTIATGLMTNSRLYELKPDASDPLRRGQDHAAAIAAARAGLTAHAAAIAEAGDVAMTLRGATEFAATMLDVSPHEAYNLIL